MLAERWRLVLADGKERLLDEPSVEAEAHAGKPVTLDAAYMRERLGEMAQDTD